MKRLALILLLSCFWNTASATFENGNNFYSQLQYCEKFEGGDTSNEYFWACGFSLGYVQGVWDTIEKSPVGRDICRPTGFTANQLKDVVYLWLKNNPANRGHTASSLVIAAMQEAWPCPEDST